MRDDIVLWAGVVFVAVFLAAFPSFYINSDEWSYLRQAGLFSRGKVSIGGVENAPSFVSADSVRYSSMYAVGQSLWLVPFANLPMPLPFLSGLIMLLLGFLIFYKILRRLRIDAKFSLLFLLFPPFLYYAASLLADLGAMVMVLAAFYFYLGEGRKSAILAGAFFGLGMLFKLPVVLIFLCFAAVALFKNREKVLWMAAGLAPFAGVNLLFNFLMYGSPFLTGYAVAGIGYIDISLILYQLPVFVFLLMTIYPLMFLALFFWDGAAKYEMQLSVVVFLIFFSGFFWSGFSGRWTDFIDKTRYFLPVIPFFILAYIPPLRNLLAKLKNSGRIFEGIVIALIAVCAIGATVHHDYTSDRLAVYDQIQQNTRPGGLVIGSLDDYVYADGRAYLDINGLRAFVNAHPEKRFNDVYFVLVHYYGRGNYTDATSAARLRERMKIPKYVEGVNAEGYNSVVLKNVFYEPAYVVIWQVEKGRSALL